MDTSSVPPNQNCQDVLEPDLLRRWFAPTETMELAFLRLKELERETFCRSRFINAPFVAMRTYSTANVLGEYAELYSANC